MTQIQSLT